MWVSLYTLMLLLEKFCVCIYPCVDSFVKLLFYGSARNGVFRLIIIYARIKQICKLLLTLYLQQVIKTILSITNKSKNDNYPKNKRKPL
ncbi:hypothetical protein BDA99DRAFT_520552 [Phascolomyces articulosus]|uniref:Secreted protein n=1 Tax=Phascolomyces articulosus TaxID=60185 RepID=A0AAD5PAH1_9FUNG|nr:hypothetical protein BDA99DRAFT_520552 [Phascolomyces articulosus]